MKKTLSVLGATTALVFMTSGCSTVVKSSDGKSGQIPSGLHTNGTMTARKLPVPSDNFSNGSGSGGESAGTFSSDDPANGSTGGGAGGSDGDYCLAAQTFLRDSLKINEGGNADQLTREARDAQSKAPEEYQQAWQDYVDRVSQGAHPDFGNSGSGDSKFQRSRALLQDLQTRCKR